ncbi:MAG TPA: SdpI family protein [Mariprofundaceae bacterium]|nr:SdpI family protein [Mariprofundaceae bacterium]
MDVYDKGFVTILGVSLLFIALALPLVRRKVPPNVIYGFRTRATLGDKTIWYEANAHMGRGLIAASLCSALVVTAIYLLRPLPADLFMPVSVLILAGPSLVATLATARFVRRLQQTNRQQNRS